MTLGDHSKVMLHDKGYAALAGLAVDADNRLVLRVPRLPDRWADRALPNRAAALLHILAFVDGILMRTGKGCKHQLPT